MNDQNALIRQVTDVFRSSRMDVTNRFYLSLQLLAWAVLSARMPRAAEESLLSVVSPSPEQINRIWDRLALQLGAAGMGFTGWKIPDWVGCQELTPAITMCQRAIDAGVVKGVDLTDSATLLVQDKGDALALPPKIADLLVALAAPRNGESIYLPWDHSAQLMGRTARSGREVYLEVPLASPVPHLISALHQGKNTVAITNPVIEPLAVEGGGLRAFDVAISFPPLNLKYADYQIDRDWYGRFPEKTSTGNVLWVRHILAQTGTRAVVAVPNSLLFGSGAEESLRHDLLSKGMVEAVVGLPPGLLYGTAIAFSILLLTKERHCHQVYFVDAKAEHFRESQTKTKGKLIRVEELIALVRNKEDSGFSLSVSVQKLLDNNVNLLPGKYVLPPEQRQLMEWQGANKTVALGELIRTVRPIPGNPSASERECLEVYEISTPDLPDFGPIRTPGRKVSIDPEALRKSRDQFLQAGDIVLIIKGNVGKVGIVESAPPPGPGGWIAGLSAIILRTHDVDPRWLLIYLRSEIGQMLIAMAGVAGTTVPLLKLSDLTQMAVPLAAIEQQHEVAADFAREIELQNQIEALRKNQIELAGKYWSLNAEN